MTMTTPLSAIYWNPNPDLFLIPYFDHPLRWYGLFFSFGLLVGTLLFFPLLKHLLKSRSICSDSELHTHAYAYLDKLLWVAVIGIVIGARLGHVFFYDWSYYKMHLSEIPKVWHGGLASHGGTAGLLIALYIFAYATRKRYPGIKFIDLCDLMAIPAAFAATCIRIGNFFNQEIVGTPTNLPWAVLFAHPADGVSAIPRHPVQLYEAIIYFATFLILSFTWLKKRDSLKPGVLIGMLFIAIFGSRFMIEFLKQPLTTSMDQTFLQTGQLLSIPFVIVGIYLTSRQFVRSSNKLNAVTKGH